MKTEQLKKAVHDMTDLINGEYTLRFIYGIMYDILFNRDANEHEKALQKLYGAFDKTGGTA